MRGRSLLRLMIALPLLLAGSCGGSDDDGVGEGLASDNTFPPIRATTSTLPTPGGVTTIATTSTAPEEVASDDYGLRVRLQAPGAAQGFRVSDTVDLLLTVENESAKTQAYNSDMRGMFMLLSADGTLAWDNTYCRVPSEPPAGSTTPALAPGASVTFREVFPDRRARPTDPSGCAVAPGRYTFVARFRWCPPDATPTGKACTPDRVAALESNRIPVELRA